MSGHATAQDLQDLSIVLKRFYTGGRAVDAYAKHIQDLWASANNAVAHSIAKSERLRHLLSERLVRLEVEYDRLLDSGRYSNRVLDMAYGDHPMLAMLKKVI